MGFLENKKILFTGVAGDRSIAAGTAKAMAFVVGNQAVDHRLLRELLQVAADSGGDVEAAGGGAARKTGMSKTVMRTSGNLWRAVLSRDHVCPWWLAYSFDNRLRRLLHRPERLVGPYVRSGMTVLDIGCGMGHFALGLAEMVGSTGKVMAVDLQPEMLEVTSARLRRAGLSERVQLHQCQEETLGVDVAADFILTFWMAHEVGRLEGFMKELQGLLKVGGHYFLAEPIVHVSAEKFGRICDAGIAAGFQVEDSPRVRFSRARVFSKRS